MKLAVVLFNLVGPDCLEAVQPFLQNLFSDPAIINLPSFLRRPLARFIAARRAPLAKKIYEHLGGRSPILPETQEQAQALEEALAQAGHQGKCFIAMRCWHPFTHEAVNAVKAFAPERIVLLPLYPQYSTTTTQSSLVEWRKEAARQDLKIPQHEVCCYPFEEGFVAGIADLLVDALQYIKKDVSYRVLFSAHGLPKRVIDRGDPYQWQVERTVEGVIARLKRPDRRIRVGALRDLGGTGYRIRKARGRSRCPRLYSRFHRAQPPGIHRSAREPGHDCSGRQDPGHLCTGADLPPPMRLWSRQDACLCLRH